MDQYVMKYVYMLAVRHYLACVYVIKLNLMKVEQQKQPPCVTMQKSQ